MAYIKQLIARGHHLADYNASHVFFVYGPQSLATYIDLQSCLCLPSIRSYWKRSMEQKMMTQVNAHVSTHNQDLNGHPCIPYNRWETMGIIHSFDAKL